MQNLSSLGTTISSLVPALIPVAVVGLVIWALAKWGHARMWALIVALVLGVFAGPDIHAVLSQLSGLLK